MTNAITAQTAKTVKVSDLVFDQCCSFLEDIKFLPIKSTKTSPKGKQLKKAIKNAPITNAYDFLFNSPQNLLDYYTAVRQVSQNTLIKMGN